MTDDPIVPASAPPASAPPDSGSPPVSPSEPAAPRSDADQAANRPGREPGDLVVAMSPRQIIGGFALLAGLLIMLRRRTRRSRRKG